MLHAFNSASTMSAELHSANYTVYKVSVNIFRIQAFFIRNGLFQPRVNVA